MKTLDCIGRDELIARLDEAVSHADAKTVTQKVKEALEDLIGNNQLQLPSETLEVLPSGYGRRLVHHSEEHGYTAIAMTWGAEQGTPIHDHCDMWCVEGVWYGNIEVTQYDLIGREGDDFNFKKVDTMDCKLGQAGTLIPPYDYHIIRNACNETTAVTLHIYAGDMKTCNAFVETDKADWYRKEEKQLCYNN